jgi:hypothetical protein
MATKAEQYRSFLERSGASRRSRTMAATAFPVAASFAGMRKDHQKAGVGGKARQLLALLSPRNRRSRQGV